MSCSVLSVVVSNTNGGYYDAEIVVFCWEEQAIGYGECGMERSLRSAQSLVFFDRRESR